MVPPWTLVVPVRHPAHGKSRLRADPELAEAIARDTLEAVARCRRIDHVVLVTDDPAWTAGLCAEVVVQTSPGLMSAVADGLAACPDGPTAIMLGDLPALRPADLDEALWHAERLPRGVVADRWGTGTTLLTALSRRDHRPAFGAGSAQRHRDAGYRDIPIGDASSLRCDVDTPADLAHAAGLLMGPRTRAVLQRQSLVAQ